MGNKPSHPKSTRRLRVVDDVYNPPKPGSNTHQATQLLAPPPYTAALEGGREIPSKRHINYETPERKENVMKMLASYNTVFLVDDSLSMANLWNQTEMALTELAAIATQHDTDGIDIYFMEESRLYAKNLRTASQVGTLFKAVKPTGEYTPIGSRLEDILLPYLAQIEAAQKDSFEALKRVKPINCIIITDGVPTDTPCDVIIAAAKRLDKGHFPLSQVGIQFLQVGHSTEAAAYLRKLDSQLSKEYEIRDMVDTTPFTGDLSGGFLMKCLLGGINRRLDRGE